MTIELKPEQEALIERYAHLTGSGSQNSHHYESISIHIGTLPEYIKAVKASLAKAGRQLQTLRGEMRSGQFSHLLPAVLSTRIWIKQHWTTLDRNFPHCFERQIVTVDVKCFQEGFQCFFVLTSAF